MERYERKNKGNTQRTTSTTLQKSTMEEREAHFVPSLRRKKGYLLYL
jgi:hypothetical protein